MNAISSSSFEPAIIDSAQEITARGRAIGLPMIATWADLSSARPATIGRNIPVAALFEFARDAHEYWAQPDLALENAIVAIIRWTAEPFYYDRGEIGGWRRLNIAPELERQKNRMTLSVRGAIVAPVHLPGSVVGAVIWATDQPVGAMRQLFDEHAAQLHVLALRFISACNAAMYGEPRIRSYRLTRREIQCLKLAAAGKTDEEIAIILDVAIPTVRFHLKKAGDKLGESGRMRIVHHAAALGFISMRL